MIEVYSIAGPSYASNCYLAVSGTESALIDPSVPVAEVRRQLGEHMVMPCWILLTHAHFDHMLYAEEWRRAGVPLAVHELDAHALDDPQKTYFSQFMGRNDRFAWPDKLLHEEERMTIGDDALTVLHTPGHTVGSVCFVGKNVIFTGDTVFAGGAYGRTDLWGGDEQALFASLHRLHAMARVSVTMYPGHGPSGPFAGEMMYFN